MDFSLSEEQTLIQDSFRRSLREVADLGSIREVTAGDDAARTRVWDTMTALGLPGILIDEAYGGAGLSLMEAAVISEELGRAAVPLPFIGSAALAPLALQLGANETQKARWLPKLASGEVRIAAAFSEAASGARRGADVIEEGGRLSGVARFALDLDGADAVLVSDNRQQVFLVECGAAGLETEPFETIDKTRTVQHLRFDRVEPEKLPNIGPNETSTIIDAGRILLAADSLGASETMLSQAVDYALLRKQFGRLIGSFQAVKHLCAEMAAEIQPCRALIWHAAYGYGALPQERHLSALLAKSHMDEVGRFVAKTATEVHGGMGFTDLLGLHFWYKRIGYNRAILGNPDRLRAEAAAFQGL